jgi:hypothetical protein
MQLFRWYYSNAYYKQDFIFKNVCSPWVGKAKETHVMKGAEIIKFSFLIFSPRNLVKYIGKHFFDYNEKEKQ